MQNQESENQTGHSRVLKFRAWDKKRMVHFTQKPWVCSEYNSICWEVDEEKEKEYLGCLDLEDDFVLMQFTGLLDKSGKEIYEGDIINFDPLKSNYKPFIGVVTYSEFGTRFIGRVEDWGDYQFYGKETEIIGNIYENPELLK